MRSVSFAASSARPTTRAISRTTARSTQTRHRSRARTSHESGNEQGTREPAAAAAEPPVLSARYFEIAIAHGDFPPGMCLVTVFVLASITEMSFDGPFAV